MGRGEETELQSRIENNIDRLIIKLLSTNNLDDMMYLHNHFKEKAAIADEEKAIKKRNRIPFYPSDWKDSFGLPVEEHKKALEINMCEGYVELTSCR